MPDPFQPKEFGMLLAETARLWRSRLDQRLKPLGLSQAKWMVLLYLSRSKSCMTQSALAERIGIMGPTLTGLLNRLAADGWIERRETALDRRSKTVHLMPKADAALQQIEATAAQVREELLEGIPEDELAHCASVILRIKQRGEQLPEPERSNCHLAGQQMHDEGLY